MASSCIDRGYTPDQGAVAPVESGVTFPRMDRRLFVLKEEVVGGSSESPGISEFHTPKAVVPRRLQFQFQLEDVLLRSMEKGAKLFAESIAELF